MNKIQLISEDYIKTHSAINEGIWGDYLTPSIREAEDIELQGVLGSCLYNSILSKVEDGSIQDDGNSAYKRLLDEFIQPFLMYQVITNLVPVIGVKLSNLGVIQSNDEYSYNLDEAQRNRIGTFYQYRADFYCREMQRFLLKNKELYPELDECSCDQMRKNLDSSATVGLWLGGIRGRRISGKNCC